MAKEKIYTISLGYMSVSLRSKEDAMNLFNSMSEIELLYLHNDTDYDLPEGDRSFHWLEDVDIKLSIDSIEIYKDKSEAQLAKQNVQKLNKMKLIPKVKK